jgi:hypothetical protein
VIAKSDEQLFSESFAFNSNFFPGLTALDVSGSKQLK